MKKEDTQKALRIILLGTTATFLAMNMTLPFASVLAWWIRWIFLGLLLYFGAFSTLSQARLKRNSALDIALYVMLACYAGSVMVSPNAGKTGLYLFLYLIQILAIIRFTRGLTLDTWRVVIVFLLIAIILGAFLTLAGVISTGAAEGRVSGEKNANSVGVSCMIGLLIAIPQCWLKTRFRWAARVTAIIPLVLLYLSGSRSSLGGLLVGTVFAFWAMRRMKAMCLVVGALLVMVFVYYGIFASPERKTALLNDLQTRVIRGETREERMSSRQGNWDECLELWRLRPTVGWGFSANDATGERPVDGGGYYGLLASVGVVGCIGFALHVLVLLGTEIKNRSRRFACFPDTDPRNPRWLFATGAGLAAGLLIQGIGEPWMIGIGSVMTLAYLFALGALLSALSWADLLEKGDPYLHQRSRF